MRMCASRKGAKDLPILAQGDQRQLFFPSDDNYFSRYLYL